MSTLADKTDKEFIVASYKAIQALDKAGTGGITFEDDVDIRTARNRLLSVIQSNGYKIDDNGKLKKEIHHV
ncbi:MAG TPA: hypothetical protein HPP97_06945 [Desulfuromonadales bacterium]|nr:hypothetical protein [Desulfuromonadales bacterium]